MSDQGLLLEKKTPDHHGEWCGGEKNSLSFVVGSGLVSSSLDNDSPSSMIVVAFERDVQGGLSRVESGRKEREIKRCRRRIHDLILRW